MNKKFNIIIFGATGFTGELCAKYLSENYPDISFAIAGRNKEKLEKIKSKNAKTEIFIGWLVLFSVQR